MRASMFHIFFSCDKLDYPAPRPRGYGAVSLKPFKMEIPTYIIREWHSHIRRIAENATCDPSDTRTANALRLARKDIRRMERYLPEYKKK